MKNGVKNTIVVGGIVALGALNACESEAQDNPIPEFPDIRYGMVQDAAGYVKDGTRIKGYYNNGTGDFFTQREDDELFVDTVTFGDAQGYRGAYKAITPTDIPTTPELEGVPEGGMQYFVAIDKNGNERILEYVVGEDTVHLVKHKKFANEELNLFTKANLENPVTAVGDVEADGSGMKAYPVPFGESTTVDISVRGRKNSERELGLYDVSGRLVWSYDGELSNGDYAISLPGDGLASGVYLLRFRNGNSISSAKLVKQ